MNKACSTLIPFTSPKYIFGYFQSWILLVQFTCMIVTHIKVLVPILYIDATSTFWNECRTTAAMFLGLSHFYLSLAFTNITRKWKNSEKQGCTSASTYYYCKLEWEVRCEMTTAVSILCITKLLGYITQ